MRLSPFPLFPRTARVEPLAEGPPLSILRAHPQLKTVRAEDWARLVVGSPFLEWGVFSAFEDSGCIGPHAGWSGQTFSLEDDAARCVGLVPGFIKAHSAGEFVFDHEWAHAAAGAGIPYYPKLIIATPFTPVEARKLYLEPGAEEAGPLFVESLWALAMEQKLSGVHWLFVTEEEAAMLIGHGYATRLGVQYHWLNRGYESFDQWLETFTSKRRRAIRRERRTIAEQGISVEVLEGDALTPVHMDLAYELYLTTIDKKVWGRQYLNREFFQLLLQRARERLVFAVARRANEVIAGAFMLQGEDTLYGRYWGCREEVKFLHFELCCYTPVQLCIERGLHRFNAGAQGEHKYERGFDPVQTTSAHRLAAPILDSAVRDFLRRESEVIRRELERLVLQSPSRAVRER